MDFRQNIEAEAGVLASILLDNDVLWQIIPILKPQDFFLEAHQVIYSATENGRLLVESFAAIEA